MTDGTTRRRVLAGASSLALPAFAGCGWTDRDERTTFERPIDVGAAGSLAIESGTGDVTVRRHDGDAVRVRGEKIAASDDAIDAVTLAVEREDERLRLRTERDEGPDPLGWWRTPKLHVEVAVPDGLRVERTATDGGDLAVQDVTGPLAAAADAGDVYVANVDGAVEASADAGDVTVRDVAGAISATADTGDVRVDGQIDAVETDTGEITATIRGLAADPSIRTDTGDVALAVARRLDVTVTAEIDLGDLEVRDELVTEDDGDAARVVLGDGSRRLAVSVDAGDVSITTLE
jgi:hypothetical protein